MYINVEYKHDIVETNKMKAEDVRSLIFSEDVALVDIDNGRICKRATGGYTLATDGTDERIFLATTPELGGDLRELGQFYNPKGKEARFFEITLGDIYSTTAYVGDDLNVGDILSVGADGKLIKGSDGARQFEVKALRQLANFKGIKVENIK